MSGGAEIELAGQKRAEGRGARELGADTHLGEEETRGGSHVVVGDEDDLVDGVADDREVERVGATRRERAGRGVDVGELDDLAGAEVEYLMKEEFARFADDILWRRSKLGLTMPRQDREALETFMAAA